LNNVYNIAKQLFTFAKELKTIGNARLNVMINAASQILYNKIQDADVKDGVVNTYNLEKIRVDMKAYALEFKKELDEENADKALKDAETFF